MKPDVTPDQMTSPAADMDLIPFVPCLNRGSLSFDRKA